MCFSEAVIYSLQGWKIIVLNKVIKCEFFFLLFTQRIFLHQHRGHKVWWQFLFTFIVDLSPSVWFPRGKQGKGNNLFLRFKIIKR